MTKPRIATGKPRVATKVADQDEWVVPTLYDWLKEAAKEQKWSMPGFIPHAGLVLVSGQAKRAFKTWFANAIAISFAAKEPISLLVPDAERKVLYIEEEGTHAGTREAMMGIIRTTGVPLEKMKNIHFAFRHRVKLDVGEWRRKIKKQIIDNDISVVILDAITYMHRANENRTDEMLQVVDTIQMIGSLGCTCIYLAHLSSARGADPKADIDDQIRGASVVTNAYDAHIALRRYHRSTPYIDLTVGQRYAAEGNYRVTWDIVEGPKDTIERAKLSIKKVDEAAELAELVEKKVKLLRSGEAYRPNDFKAVWNLGAKLAKTVREQLVSEGKLVETGRNVWQLVQKDD